MPFLLRAVKLLGIDSVMQPYERRVQARDHLVHDLPRDRLAAITSICGLAELPGKSAEILKGQVRGRLVVDLNG